MLRTHTCGELNIENIGRSVILTGWVNSCRNMGGLIFFDLRDRYGITQIMFDPNEDTKITETLNRIKNEWVLKIEGEVVARPQEMKNPQIITGEIEIRLKNIEILSKSLALPFELSEEKSDEVNEALRLQYRFLDLRRPKLQTMLATKDKFITYVREYFHNLGFTEVQTPILANSSPEGARDFLVPSRLYPGKFYALPQAPQQFKQLLMIGGLDKYFQIAPCFRDEDPRTDRHYGEFYQLDMEMSFVEQDDIFQVMEPLMILITEKFSGKKIINLQASKRFAQISWQEAMNRFGTDKPDLRFSMEITDISSLVKESGFTNFDKVLDGGGCVKTLKVDGGALFSRKEIDELTEIVKKKGTKGLSYALIKNGQTQSSLTKFISAEIMQSIVNQCGAKDNDIVFFVADEWRVACLALGELRNCCATKLGLKDNQLAAWVWVVDFPIYEYSEIEPGRIDFAHNPFSMPQGGMAALKNSDPLTILGQQFDLVLNGYEISSGAIRNHDPEIMYEAFRIAGYAEEEVDRKFGALIKAFSYGTPPHGGNAPGIDRLLMVLNDWESIRDIYAFPKSGKGIDLMNDSPSVVDKKQTDELHLAIINSE